LILSHALNKKRLHIVYSLLTIKLKYPFKIRNFKRYKY
jgi:hypothetical protein